MYIPETAAAPSGDSSKQPRLARRQIIQHVRKSLLYTPFDVRWVPQSAQLTVAGQHPNNNGALNFYQLRKGELVSLAELRTPLPLKCCTYAHNYYSGERTAAPCTLAVGDFGGGLQVVDAERVLAAGGGTTAESRTLTDLAPFATFSAPHAHESIVNCIDGARYAGPAELLSGGRDGAVRVWDCRQPQKAVVAFAPADAARARDCWTVRFGNSTGVEDRVVAAGYDNGDVKLFDLRNNNKAVSEFNVGCGVCDLEFDRADIAMNKLVVSMLEGRVRVYDLRTLHPTLGYAYVEERDVSAGTVWASRALPQNREVFIAGGGGDLVLYKYEYPPERSLRDAANPSLSKGVPGTLVQVNKARVGDQPINSMDWCRGKEGLLAATSFDQSLRVVLVTKLKQLR